MNPATSDEAIVEQYRASPAAAQQPLADELFQRHYLRVARWCFRFTGDREAAADLAQEVFLKAHRHLHTFQGSSRFTTWLYTIARRESLNRLQQRKTAPALEDDGDALADVPAVDPGPEELAVRSNRARRLHAFLAETLDDTERQVFTLHYGNDMPLDAITRLLRLENTSGAKAYIVSAKRKLARAVQRQRARGGQL
jgi:RNA polymerase sigma-70 factor (ECF subfamily)